MNVHVPQRINWTDDRKDDIAVLLIEGLTAGEIGARMGVTKNAIISIVGRDERLKSIGFAQRPNRPFSNGLSIKSNRKHGGIQGGKPRKIHPGNIARKADSRKHDPGCVETPASLPDEPTRKVSLVEMEAGACRFPIGDPQEEDFGFCAQQIREGSAYCPHHHRICHAGFDATEGA